jgi:hypothetical protein
VWVLGKITSTIFPYHMLRRKPVMHTLVRAHASSGRHGQSARRHVEEDFICDSEHARTIRGSMLTMKKRRCATTTPVLLDFVVNGQRSVNAVHRVMADNSTDGGRVMVPCDTRTFLVITSLVHRDQKVRLILHTYCDSDTILVKGNAVPLTKVRKV